jgi:hypothetical protein
MGKGTDQVEFSQRLGQKPERTYVDDDGNGKRDRRRKGREDDDPRIEHLFNGFDNLIQNADGYTKGYVQAMRAEFGQLIASLVRGRPNQSIPQQ